MEAEQNSKIILARIKSALGIRTNRQLAYALGVTQQAVYYAQKKAVPMSWVVGAAQVAHVSIDWLLNGHPVNSAGTVNGEEALSVFRNPYKVQILQAPSFAAVTRKLMEVLGVDSEDAFADKLKVSTESFAAARKQGVFPPDWLLRLTRRHHLQLSQILPASTTERSGEQSIVEQKSRSLKNSTTADQAWTDGVADCETSISGAAACDYCLIPKCRPLVGSDCRLLRDEGAPPMAFGKGWLGNWGDPANMVMIEVSGEHLEPLLFDGDMVLLDCSRRTPMTGRFFAVSIDGHAVIRRIDLLPGRIVLCSENKKYGPLEIANDSGGFSILGMAVWFGRKLVDS